MAKSNTREDKKLHKEIENQVHQDLLVRNMPKSAKVKGSKMAPRKAARTKFNSQDNSSSKNNFKAVGFIIIFIGIIFVIGLVYLGYRYIIQPGLGTTENVATVTPTTQNSPSADKPTTPEPVASSTNITPSAVDVDIISPVELDLATSTHEEIEIDEVSAPAPILDSDGDGLNDEEEVVLGTNLALSDSDGDGYEDLAELNNNYNPNGPGLLIDSPSVTKYENSAVGYTIIYPTNWQVDSLSNGNTTIFTATNNSIIQVSVQGNANIQSILNWYEGSFPDSVITYDLLNNNDNWDGITGPDGFNFYLTDKSRKNIYVISYISAINDQLTYPAIFELMINSLVIQ